MLFVPGVANDDKVRQLVTEPLTELPFRRPVNGRPTIPALSVALGAAPGRRVVSDLQETVSAVLEGWTALFVKGGGQAIVLDTRGPAGKKRWEADPVGFGNRYRGRFASWQDWEAWHWPGRIPDLEVEVEAEMRVRRYGLVSGRRIMPEER